jgi:hypothetical protein
MSDDEMEGVCIKGPNRSTLRRRPGCRCCEHGIHLQIISALMRLHTDYGFEYSEDDEPEEDEQIETENTYYGAKGLRCLCMLVTQPPPQLRMASFQLMIILIAAALEGENYQEALEGFEKVVALENSDKGEWCASVHRQMSAAQLYDPKCTHNC